MELNENFWGHTTMLNIKPYFPTHLSMIFFVAKSEVCKFVDDTTLCSCGKHLLRIKQDLIYDKEILLK